MTAALGGRPPLIWDNYPGERRDDDGRRCTSARTRVATPSLADVVGGVLCNPMMQPHASKIALATAAAFLRDPDDYDPSTPHGRPRSPTWAAPAPGRCARSPTRAPTVPLALPGRARTRPARRRSRRSTRSRTGLAAPPRAAAPDVFTADGDALAVRGRALGRRGADRSRGRPRRLAPDHSTFVTAGAPDHAERAHATKAFALALQLERRADEQTSRCSVLASRSTRRSCSSPTAAADARACGARRRCRRRDATTRRPSMRVVTGSRVGGTRSGGKTRRRRTRREAAVTASERRRRHARVQRGGDPRRLRRRSRRGPARTRRRLRGRRVRERLDRRHARHRARPRREVSRGPRRDLHEADYGRALRAGLLAAEGTVVVNFDVDYYDLDFLDVRSSHASPRPTAEAIVVGSKRSVGSQRRRGHRYGSSSPQPSHRLARAVRSEGLRHARHEGDAARRGRAVSRVCASSGRTSSTPN